MDEIRINAPKGTKFIFIFCLVLTAVCIILLFTPFAESNSLRLWFFLVFIAICDIVFFYELKKTYLIDANGITRTFLVFSKQMKWSEMKYIGACFEHNDTAPGVTSGPRRVMLFMTISYSEYDKHHSFAGLIKQEKYVFTIEYIDDATYQKILSFSGGERNIP